MNRCGTHLGYRDHQIARTTTCRPCRDAQAAWQRDYEKRRYINGAGLLIDGTGTRRRLQALAVMGWSSGYLSDRLNSTRSYASALMHRDRVQLRTARKVAALYEELSMVHGPYRRAALDARRKGWVPPLGWDAEDLDDPAARPRHRVPNPAPGRPRDTDRDERIWELTRAGLSSAEIAVRLRTTKRQVERVRARHRSGEAVA